MSEQHTSVFNVEFCLPVCPLHTAYHLHQVLYPKSYRCVHCHAAYILLGVHLECKEPRCSKVREIIRLGGWILGGAGQINCSLLFQKTTSYKNNYQIHFAAGLRRCLSVQKDQSQHSGESGCHHYKESIKVWWYHSYMLFGDSITTYLFICKIPYSSKFSWDKTFVKSAFFL